MARVRAELTTAEVVTIGELDDMAINSVIWKNSSGVYERIVPGATGTALVGKGVTTAPVFEVNGVGDVIGPATATDDAIATYDLTTGKLIQNTVVTIAQTTGNMAGVGTLGCGTFTTSGHIIMSGNETDFHAPNNNDGDYMQFYARDSDIDSQTIVGGLYGASDPYFGLGGAAEFKFYTSGDALVALDKKIQFGDAAVHIMSDDDGHLDLTADTSIDLNANVALGANNLTMTGSLADTTNRVTKGWFIDLQVTNAIAGSITGNAGTVSTITGLAPNTATTQATQANITTCANLVSVGTITTGGLGTGAVLADVTMTLGSDADGDIYYRSSNKLTRLAKGTALYGLRMNAGATAPEWAEISGGGTAPQVQFIYDGEVPVGTLLTVPIHTTFEATGIRISTQVKPAGADFEIHVTKNGIASTDSIVTSDATVDIATGDSTTNGIYQDVTTSIDNGSFSAGDVLYIICNQQGTTTQASDLTVTVY